MKLPLYFLTTLLGIVLAVHLAMNGKVGAVLNNARVGNALFWCIGAVGAVIIGLTGLRLEAQIAPPAPDSPTFEAASIRPATDTGRRGGRGTPGRFQGINLPARQLIRQAYDIHDTQIIGGPDWLASEGFDINATTGDKPPDQMRFMMQSLLRDRFKLTFHTEKRELPTYALVVARSDGRLGSGLKRIPD